MRLQDLGALQKDCNERLKKKIEAIRLALDDDYRVEFELITTGNLTEAAAADLSAFSETLSEQDFPASLHLIDTEVLKARLAEAEARAAFTGARGDPGPGEDPQRGAGRRADGHRRAVTRRVPQDARDRRWAPVCEERPPGGKGQMDRRGVRALICQDRARSLLSSPEDPFGDA